MQVLGVGEWRVRDRMKRQQVLDVEFGDIRVKC